MTILISRVPKIVTLYIPELMNKCGSTINCARFCCMLNCDQAIMLVAALLPQNQEVEATRTVCVITLVVVPAIPSHSVRALCSVYYFLFKPANSPVYYTEQYNLGCHIHDSIVCHKKTHSYLEHSRQ